MRDRARAGDDAGFSAAGARPPRTRRCKELPGSRLLESGCAKRAGVAHLVERNLPKVEVAGSRPVARSIFVPTDHWLGVDARIEVDDFAHQESRSGHAGPASGASSSAACANAAAPFPTLFNSFTQAGFDLDHMSLFNWIESRVPGGHTSKMAQLLDVAYNIEFANVTTQSSAMCIVYLLFNVRQFAIF